MREPRLDDPVLLQRLLNVCRSLMSELDLEAVLRRVVAEASELTGARYAALGVLNSARDGLDRFITTGIDAEGHRAIGDLPRGRGVLGALISDPRPLRLADVGAHPVSYGFPPSHPPMKTFLGVPIMIRGSAYGNLYLTEKAGGKQFSDTDEEVIGILADVAGVAIDNARLYQRVDARRDELERAVIGLEATTEIARAVGGETDLDRILELISKRGRALVNARAVAILLEDRQELSVLNVAGDVDADVIGRTIPIANSVYADVLRSQQPQRIADLRARLRAGGHSIGVEAESALLVPLVFRGRALGVLAAYDHADGPAGFTVSDQQLMLSFAASAATALGTAKTVAQEYLRHSIEATENERRRWARELHDETLQGLGGLNVMLNTGLNGDLETAVRTSLGFIEEQIASLRALISDLRPAVLDDLGIQPALEALAERVEATSGLRVDLDIDLAYERQEAATRLTPEIESAVYRLVQETLTNVSKHAGVDRASVRVHESNGALAVEVRDTGVGFELDEGTGGFGLLGMRERVDLVDGKLAVVSRPGEGTTVSVVIPALHREQEPPRATRVAPAR